jgi:glycosyltransferase involved in cell wall biosynthesis
MNFAFLFPRFKILSGAERLILKLAQALVEKGHSITIVCHQFDPSCKPLLSSKIDLKVSGVRLDYFKNRYLNAAFDYFRSTALAPMLPEKIDAVCCFGPALAIAPDLLKSQQLPVLYFCYEPPRFLYTDREVIQKKLNLSGFFVKPFFDWYRNKDQKLVRSVTAILSNSYFGAEQIQKIYDKNARVITHGLEQYKQSNKRSEIRNQFGFQEEDIVVATVNYLHPRKRIDLFLESVSNARKINQRIKGLVVGDGPEKQRLMQHPDAVVARFTGFVHEADLHDYYQAADIYLHTARLETFGLSVIEASANKLPVISVNEGGPCETVIPNQTGLLVESSSDAISAAILTLAEDLEMRKRLGNAGEKYVRGKYSWDQGAQDFLDTLIAFQR